MSDDLDKLAELDDMIVGTDQEDLDAIEKLNEQRSLLLEQPLEPPSIEEPPEAEPQIEPKPVEETPDDVVDMNALRKKYTIPKLFEIADKHGVNVPSRNERKIIQALLDAGVEL